MLVQEPSLRFTAFLNRDASPALARELGVNLQVRRLPVSARRPEQWSLGELALLPVAGRRARVDVMHSLANFGPASGPFARVLTVHDLQYRAVPELLTPVRRMGTEIQLSLAVRHADRIIAVSGFAREELVQAFPPSAERITVIPNGLGTPPAAGASEDSLRALFALDKRPVCLSVGSNLPHKNLPLLLTALAGIPSDRRPLLVVTGSGTDGPELRQLARLNGVEADSRLLGYQPSEVVEGLYRLASCLALPSRYEGFGLTALEAMARGLPVACADIPALREVTGAAALRFSPSSATEAADTIVRLIEDRALARRLTEAGLQQAARFSWTAAARSTLECYEHVSARRANAEPSGSGIREA